MPSLTELLQRLKNASVIFCLSMVFAFEKKRLTANGVLFLKKAKKDMIKGIKSSQNAKKNSQKPFLSLKKQPIINASETNIGDKCLHAIRSRRYFENGVKASPFKKRRF